MLPDNLADSKQTKTLFKLETKKSIKINFSELNFGLFSVIAKIHVFGHFKLLYNISQGPGRMAITEIL